MIIEIAAAMFCFGNGICYDQSKVSVKVPEIATVITDGQRIAPVIINCSKKTHTIYANGDSIEGPFEKGSVMDAICVKYLSVE